MRGRSYRRHIEECKVIKRLRYQSAISQRYYRYNGSSINNPRWMDYIGSTSQFMYKTYTTSKHDSKYKEKYSNRNRNYGSGDPNTREYDKKLFLKILRENGLK